MAAYVKASEYLYIGASTDTKPSGVPTGTQCIEYTVATNTSKWYMTDNGGTNWRELSDPFLAAAAADVAKIPKSDGTVSWNATAVAAIQAAAQAAITASALGTAAELAKVPKSDAAVTFNATALGSINAEVDTALNTIVPASPTAGSLNDMLSKAAGGNTFVKATDSLEAISDKLGNPASTLAADIVVLTAIINKITNFSQETVGATDVNGVTWKDLLDKSVLTKYTEICGFMVTVAGGWAGNAKIRITDGAGTKIFPFQGEYVQGTDFVSAGQIQFNFPVKVPAANGYKFQFRSSNAADGAGKTLQLNNLDVMTYG